MKPGPIVPATVDFGADGPPRAPAFGDVYHPREGAWGQARHVFLGGNGLPARWQGRDDFVVVETGFGLGSNFLALWQAWREDPHRCSRLHVVSLELHPPVREDLLRAHAGTPLAALAEELARAWPPPTPDLHLLEFEGGALRLLLGLGDARRLLPRLRARVDACFLDGFAPARNPQMWEPGLFKALARLAAPGATAATWSAARAVREGLQAAGFEVETAPGHGAKREMTRARHAPRGGHGSRAAVGWRGAGGDGEAASREAGEDGPAGAAPARHALVIGAGLAGASAAASLARLGWRCTVLERNGQAAAEASGNPAGVFHPAAHAADNPHARLLRAASLLAARRYAALVGAGRVRGEVRGMLQVPGHDREPGREQDPEPHAERLSGPDIDPALEEGRPQAHAPAGNRAPHPGDHPDIVQPASSASAAALTGLPRVAAGVRFGPAGWVVPPDLVAAWLQAPGVELVTGAAVTDLARAPGGWCALDAAGRVLAQAPVVVLAAGTGLPALVQAAPVEPLELGTSRGQLGWFDAAAGPKLPMTGQGYALAMPGPAGVRLVFGATSHEGDNEPAMRDEDARWNAARLRALSGLQAPPPEALGGRVAWRVTTPDRLPVAGPLVPAGLSSGRSAEMPPPGRRLDQARFVPRQAGLYVIGGFGSRGLTWAPLLGEVLAAWVAGTPQPLTADLLDALDPARGLVRKVRRSPPVARAGGTARADQAPDGPG